MKKIILIIFLLIYLLTDSSCMMDQSDVLYLRDLENAAREGDEEAIERIKAIQQRPPSIFDYFSLLGLMCLVIYGLLNGLTWIINKIKSRQK